MNEIICNHKKGVYGYIPTQIIPYLLDNLNDGNINAHIENIDKLKSLTEESNPVIFYYE